MIPRVLIAGTHSGAGKTTVTLAIISALMRRGLKVQVFKAGPDFIDPSYHSRLTLRPCRNLDTWMLGKGVSLEILQEGSKDADIAVVEGVMGLYDGFSGEQDAGSSADLAKTIGAPVVLVVDAKGMAGSAAAMIKGFVEFDPALRFAGVIFNNVGSNSHYEFLKKAVERSLSMPVLGYLPRVPEASIAERHLGLVPSLEGPNLDRAREALGRTAEQTIHLDLLIQNARRAPDIPVTNRIFVQRGGSPAGPAPRIAVAWDKAFHFYYTENFELLRLAGADLVFFSPLADRGLPQDTDMLYIGGGFPEMHAAELSANASMRQAVRNFILAKKLPAYAECGGLMYLCQAIRTFDGSSYPMVGVIPADACMSDGRKGLGYLTVEVLQDTILGLRGEILRGHEFHWSYLEEKPGFQSLPHAYRVHSRIGQKIKPDGIVLENLLASYTHLHFANAPHLAERLVKRLRSYSQAGSTSH